MFGIASTLWSQTASTKSSLLQLVLESSKSRGAWTITQEVGSSDADMVSDRSCRQCPLMINELVKRLGRVGSGHEEYVADFECCTTVAADTYSYGVEIFKKVCQ